MILALTQLDRILRGEATRPDVLRDEGIRFPIRGLTIVLIVLGAIYGACMGVFAQTTAGSGSHMQIVASALKVPLLFVLTLIVTLPSLYVFNALLGSRLTPGPLVRLMLGALAVTMSVLASIGPIVAFFSVSTTSYPFITLLNVFVFAVSGLLGLMFLKQTLNRLTAANRAADFDARSAERASAPAYFETAPVSQTPPPFPSEEASTFAERAMPVGALDAVDDSMLGRHTRKVFAIWMFVFGLVGSQMAWILRPFIGSPGKAFTWFRPIDSNFFEAVWGLAKNLLGA